MAPMPFSSPRSKTGAAEPQVVSPCLVPVLVELRDDGVDVWRPVDAERLADGSYRIVTENPDPEDEHWAFPTGSIVRCEERTFDGEARLVAVALARHAG
jgi:hypothetical protein